jgi:hypothetical protein
VFVTPGGVDAEICALISACMSLLSSFSWVAVNCVTVGVLVFPVLMVSVSMGILFGKFSIVWGGVMFCAAVVSFLVEVQVGVSLG